MTHLDIDIIVHCASLFAPLAGIGRIRRSSRLRPGPSIGVTKAEVIVPARRAGVYARWRKASDGSLIMDWRAE
jgi:hypothetical protein